MILNNQLTEGMEQSPEYLKLEESIKCLDELQTSIAVIKNSMKNLKEENIRIVIQEISAEANSNPVQNCVSLPCKNHQDLKKCIETLCTIRPKLMAYTSAIEYCKSIDAEKVIKLINKKVEKMNDISIALEDNVKNIINKIDNLLE